MITYSEDIHDINNLLLPLGNRVGAVNRVKNLISEMQHPNIDWKFVVMGLRAYLYDHIHDISGHSDKVFPVLYHYLKEATVRKKASAIRAGDTFFDRYLFVIKNAPGRDGTLEDLRRFFDRAAADYLDLLIRESSEGFYFENVNERVLHVGGALSAETDKAPGVLAKINEFLRLQYALYVKRSVVTSDRETEEIIERLGLDASSPLPGLLLSVSERAYADSVASMQAAAAGDAADEFRKISALADFSLNSRTWEKICLSVKSLIETSVIPGDDAITGVLAFIIRKSREGEDHTLHLFMSRTVASVCGSLDRLQKPELLRSVVDMVMPGLLEEIERGGNYFSAFATIYNIGKTIIDAGRVSLVDHFVDILVRSRFCFPEFTGIASDWSVMVNSSHLENIRTWLRLIEINPPIMKKLAAALIVNLKLGGVFLKDTDVFQRDISQLLNSNYRDVFYLLTSLAAVFPAFFHDIGATGNIRAFTEKIDTNHQMNDVLHFIRKQVHVESSSRTVLLIQRVMDFWMTGDGTPLRKMVPAEVYDNLDYTWRLINLDQEEGADTLFSALRLANPDIKDVHFWDFLNTLGRRRFEEFVRKAEAGGADTGRLKDLANCIYDYYDKQFPAEMTKMLHHIRGMFDIDTSRTQIWKFLYEVSDDEFRNIFENVRLLDVSRVNIEKFITFLHVYRMIFDKYNFSDVRDVEKLEQYAWEGLFDPPADLFERLRGADVYAALEALLDLQYSLKWNILLSGTRFEAVDTIEFKRHIAFGIPSMYGSYKEKKFDTLKVFFHCNLIRERLFDTLIEVSKIFPRELINYADIARVLRLFYRSFVIDGLANHELTSIISLLDAPNMKTSQFRDIVNTLSTINGEISDLFNETYKYVCKTIISNIGAERMVEEYLPSAAGWSIEVIVDRFLRSQIMQSPLLQLFDNLLIRLRERIESELEIRGDRECLNVCDLRKQKGTLVYPIRRYSEGGSGDLFVPLWQTGAKAQGLIIAAGLEGINVPEGIVISTELYKRLREGDISNPRFMRKIIYSIRKQIEIFTGGRFANPQNPILLSVRSGAVFSMPGVMDTITNVGVTQEILDYLSQYDPWFAYDCYRRLIHDFAISSFGMERTIFEKLMAKAKEEAGADLKEKLTGREMEVLTKKYRFTINKAGFTVPKDPYEQLYYAIISVYRSWDSPVAKNYRQFINVSDEWGTAVIIQRMVFGNQSPRDVTGVVHSQYMGHESIGLFGEYKTRAQGHDIVSGIARVFPISEEQRYHYEAGASPSLEKTYPDLYRTIYDAVRKIRDRWGNEVEIEFTVEKGVLYILQVRGMANHIFDTEELESSPEDLQEYLLGKGLAASGGAISGRAVFDIGRIDLVRERFPEDKIIIIRPETNPEDVLGIKKSDGILTCIGGMTSHAVLQMRRLEKSGVSDFAAMKIDERNNMAIVNRDQEKGKAIIREGDFITIDGSTGHVYLGFHPTVKKGL